MINPQIEDLCDSIRQALSCEAVPVDVLKIATEEQIELAPGEYGRDFHGRIEFLPEVRTFVIYYPSAFASSSEARIRFSVAHELGHYYMPGHREALLQCQGHDSVTGFTSAKEREREADEFAACLLVPKRELDQRMGRKGFMDIAAIVKMAQDLQVSVPAAIIRYVQYTEEKCGVVVAQALKAKYYIASDDMRTIGLGFLKRDALLPKTSKAAELLSKEVFRQPEGKLTSTAEWFGTRPVDLDLWEDSYALGYDDQVITLLSVQAKC